MHEEEEERENKIKIKLIYDEYEIMFWSTAESTHINGNDIDFIMISLPKLIMIDVVNCETGAKSI